MALVFDSESGVKLFTCYRIPNMVQLITSIMTAHAHTFTDARWPR